MAVLKTFGSAEAIANADIRRIRRYFEYKGRGRRISLTPEMLKDRAKSSVGIPSSADVIQIRDIWSIK